MTTPVTVKDVAAAAGVSVATAARVLGGYGYASDGARKRVNDAASSLGYVPNRIARALSSGLSGVVGLVVGDIDNPFFSAAARGVSDVLENVGFTLILANSDENHTRETRMVEALRSRQTDGLIVAPASESSGSYLATLAESGYPVVLLDREIEGLPVDAVTVDNLFGAIRAVEHLIASGHTRIGMVTEHPEMSPLRDRVTGYRTALVRAGLDVSDADVAVGGSTRDDGLQTARALLDRDTGMTAVFATTNFMTLGLLRAAAERGLHLPGQLSVVGFDDAEWTTVVTPPISVVAQPAYELGRAAASQLVDRIEGARGPGTLTKLATAFIERESVAAPAG